MTAIQATGTIRLFQIVTAGVLLLNLPISFVFLKNGYSPQTTMIVSIIISVFAQYLRIIFANRKLGMKLVDYFYQVLLPIVLVSFFSSIFPVLLLLFMKESMIRLFVMAVTSVVSVVVSTYLVGMSPRERLFFINILKTKFHKNENHQ